MRSRAPSPHLSSPCAARDRCPGNRRWGRARPCFSGDAWAGQTAAPRPGGPPDRGSRARGRWAASACALHGSCACAGPTSHRHARVRVRLRLVGWRLRRGSRQTRMRDRGDPPCCLRRPPTEPIPADARKSCEATGTARLPATGARHLEIEQPGYGHNPVDRDDTQPKIQLGRHAGQEACRACAKGSVGCACAPPVVVRLRRHSCSPVAPAHTPLSPEAMARVPLCHSVCSRALDRGPERERWGVESHARSKIRATPSRRLAPGCVRMRGRACASGSLPRQKPGGREAPSGREKRSLRWPARDWVSSLAVTVRTRDALALSVSRAV